MTPAGPRVDSDSGKRVQRGGGPRAAVAIAAAAVALLLAPGGRVMAGPAERTEPKPAAAPVTAAAPLAGATAWAPASGFGGPYHGSPDRLAYGGTVELRFAEDRVLGVSNPEWFSFGNVGGFLVARIHPRVHFAWKGTWDRGVDDFSMEYACLDARLGVSTRAHAGIFLVPLGRANLQHDAPRREFDDLSLVDTQIIGVPNAQLGIGVLAGGRFGESLPYSYEIDLVTGYDDGIVMDSPGGTRIPSGRNNYGDNNGMPALVARLAVQPGARSEFGLAAQSGQYNETSLGGVEVDAPRYVHLFIADGAWVAGGVNLSGEAAAALVDVPPGLEALYAQRQWGGTLEAARVLRAPMLNAWRASSLTIAVRADAVDFDAALAGDSRSRVAASLNLRPRAASVLRLGWYYEVERDRFNNSKPAAGLVLGVASYF